LGISGLAQQGNGCIWVGKTSKTRREGILCLGTGWARVTTSHTVHFQVDALWRWATLRGLVATWLVIGMGDRSERLKGWLGPERVVMLVCTVTAGILLLYVGTDSGGVRLDARI
jgi:hypothetical protein